MSNPKPAKIEKYWRSGKFKTCSECGRKQVAENFVAKHGNMCGICYLRSNPGLGTKSNNYIKVAMYRRLNIESHIARLRERGKLWPITDTTCCTE